MLFPGRHGRCLFAAWATKCCVEVEVQLLIEHEHLPVTSGGHISHCDARSLSLPLLSLPVTYCSLCTWLPCPLSSFLAIGMCCSAGCLSRRNIAANWEQDLCYMFCPAYMDICLTPYTCVSVCMCVSDMFVYIYLFISKMVHKYQRVFPLSSHNILFMCRLHSGACPQHGAALFHAC